MRELDREKDHCETRTRGLLSVIIVTFNSSAIIAQCLEPIVNRKGIEIVVVDNASSDGTLELVRENYPNVRLIDGGANLGFAKGVNLGVTYANGDAIVLLNPDASIIHENLLALRKVLSENPDIGIVAPLLDHPGRALSVREGGMLPTIWHVFCHYFGLSRLFIGHKAFSGMYILRSQNFDSIDVDWVSGACMAVPFDVWVTYGGLSERWFMYAEDVELCMRVRNGGKRVVISAEITATHGLGGSSGSTEEDPTNALWLTNLFDLYKTSISPSRLHNLVWKLVFTGGLAARSLATALRTISNRQLPSQNVDFRRFNFYIRELARESSLRGSQ